MLLALETSTKLCSVALLLQDGQVAASASEKSDRYVHSEKLHVFIRQVMQQGGLKMQDLQAVAVGKGPGSYTGLRIGISAAKGLCYALNIPLFSADGPEILTEAFLQKHRPEKHHRLIPVIDARRMEVYSAIHDGRGERIREIEAQVLHRHSFDEPGDVIRHIFGDGAEKCRSLFSGNEGIKVYSDIEPLAEDLGRLALQKMKRGTAEDTAYFEPFYLKDFKAIKPKNPFV